MADRSVRGQARSWLDKELAALWRSSAPPQRIAESERALRHQVALLLLPLEPYVGLTLEQARAHARAEGRVVVEGRSSDWRADRVVVEVADGVVVRAETDGLPWAGG